jgi:serine-type D-Ala-D-Ala carboxypeptidase/endopeptidase
MRTHLLSLAAVALFTMPALAMSDSDLRGAIEQRFKDDRTGACVAAAVIDNGTTAPSPSVRRSTSRATPAAK